MDWVVHDINTYATSKTKVKNEFHNEHARIHMDTDYTKIRMHVAKKTRRLRIKT